MALPIDDQLIGRFIDAAVNDVPLARKLLASYPGLRTSRWLHKETLLHFLAVEGFSDAVAFLAANGFDVNTPNECGDPPLIDVATLGNDTIAACLLTHGANPNVTSKTRDTALHCAVRSNNVALVKRLLEAGATGKARHVLHNPHYELYGSVSDSAVAIRALLQQYGIAPEDPI